MEVTIPPRVATKELFMVVLARTLVESQESIAKIMLAVEVVHSVFRNIDGHDEGGTRLRSTRIEIFTLTAVEMIGV